MGFYQNNNVRGRIIGESDRCQNSILETLRDGKVPLTYYKKSSNQYNQNVHSLIWFTLMVITDP